LNDDPLDRNDNPLDPAGDPFGPPEDSVEVECLHCRQRYQSHQIEWRIETDAEGKLHGFWCCPMPGCGGMGFGFDILPTDPNYHDERGGWVQCDDDDYDEEDFDEGLASEDAASDGPVDHAKPSGNGHGRPKIEEDWSDDVPF
jgi:hypothetical protein